MMAREEACFSEEDFEEAIRQYWGEFRQAAKFQRSRQVVLAYQERIRAKVSQLPNPLGEPNQSRRKRKRRGKQRRAE